MTHTHRVNVHPRQTRAAPPENANVVGYSPLLTHTTFAGSWEDEHGRERHLSTPTLVLVVVVDSPPRRRTS